MSEVAGVTYRLEDLRGVSPSEPPSDFADHWQRRYARARRVDPAMQMTPVKRLAGHQIYRVKLRSTDDRTIGGWLALPTSGPAQRGLVQSHGYGGREQIDPAHLRPDTAVLWPVARGLPTASIVEDLPSNAQEHVLVGIEDRESYILGGCAEDIWCSATALATLIGDVPLAFIGRSFGGGQGALALPWDSRFVAGALELPSFGQYDLRLRIPCVGSGEPVRSYVASHPEVREVLRYFDASSAARFINVPMIVAGALLDPAVPPPGQWAVHNAIPHAATYVLSAGHTSYPTEEAEAVAWQHQVREFMSAHVAA